MRHARVLGLGLCLCTVAMGLAPAMPPQKPASDKIAFPKGYRSWTHVKSMLIYDKSHPLFDKFGGIHHVYANNLAVPTLRKGGVYPNGAEFVFDLFEAKVQGGAYIEGNRKVLAAMVKDARRYARTGGWGFEAWAGGDAAKPMVKDAATECFACHASQKKTGYVYSAWRP